MAEFLAYRILDGKLEYSKVPTKVKNEVRQILIDLGHDELIK